MNIIKKTLIRVISRFFPFLMYARAQGELHKARKLANSKIAINVTTGEGTSFFIPGAVAGIDIAPEVFFRKFCNVLIYPNATLIIEEKVFFNNYCSINCLGRIEIGAKTVFGEGVKLYDHNHQYQYAKDCTLILGKDDYTIGTIKIGKNCWIGSNVTILNNVEIGDNVIIGAHCLIYKSIPANAVVKHKEELIITVAK